MHIPNPHKYYIFYDGECAFCNFWVQWILKNDKKDRFLFASLQSDFGQKFLKERNLKDNDFDTIFLWRPTSYYLIKSQAVIEIAKLLGGKFYLLSVLKIIPKKITDTIYYIIATHRKRLIKHYCLIPTDEQKAKFISFP